MHRRARVNISKIFKYVTRWAFKSKVSVSLSMYTYLAFLFEDLVPYTFVQFLVSSTSYYEKSTIN